MAAAAARQQKAKTKGPPAKQQPRAAATKKRKRKYAPLLPPGTAVEVLRNGSWVGGGTVTIRNDRTYMVRLTDMTVLMTRARVRPALGRPGESGHHRTSLIPDGTATE